MVPGSRISKWSNFQRSCHWYLECWMHYGLALRKKTIVSNPWFRKYKIISWAGNKFHRKAKSKRIWKLLPYLSIHNRQTQEREIKKRTPHQQSIFFRLSFGKRSSSKTPSLRPPIKNNSCWSTCSPLFFRTSPLRGWTIRCALIKVWVLVLEPSADNIAAQG